MRKKQLNNKEKKKVAGAVICAIIILIFLLSYLTFIVLGIIYNGPIVLLIVMGMPIIAAAIGLIISLIQRINEIYGGEEDAVTKY